LTGESQSLKLEHQSLITLMSTDKLYLWFNYRRDCIKHVRAALAAIFATSIYLNSFEPLDSQKGALLFEDNFENVSAKTEWTSLNGTRWSVEK